jgi:hypothetical protein
MSTDRIALIVEGVNPVDCVVIAPGEPGDVWLSQNPAAVEVTGLDPMPGVGNGWSYVKGKWVAPVVPEPVEA